MNDPEGGSELESPQSRYIWDRDFIGNQYKLPLIRDILADTKDVVGVSRFIVLPAMVYPEELYTFTFTTTSIRIDVTVGETRLWASFPFFAQTILEDDIGAPFQVESRPFNAERASRQSKEIPISHLRRFEPFSSWASLKAASAEAVSCDGRRLDGIGYRHRLCDRESEIYVEWRNPVQPEHASQLRLIRLYGKLLRKTGVSPKHDLS